MIIILPVCHICTYIDLSHFRVIKFKKRFYIFVSGNPNGYDPIQLCYEMSKRGIVLYVLSYEPSVSYNKAACDILEGIAKITDGYYLALTNADLLLDIISNSLKQEITLKIYWKIYYKYTWLKLEQKNDEVITDEQALLNKLDLDLIRKLKMDNKIEIGNVYKGESDYTNDGGKTKYETGITTY